MAKITTEAQPLFAKWGLSSQKLTAKAPEKWWLGNDPFLLGPGNFVGATIDGSEIRRSPPWMYITL